MGSEQIQDNCCGGVACWVCRAMSDGVGREHVYDVDRYDRTLMGGKDWHVGLCSLVTLAICRFFVSVAAAIFSFFFSNKNIVAFLSTQTG